MVVIRIGPRGLASLGMALALAVGLGIGSLRPVERVIAATQASPAGDVLPAQTATSGPRITTEQAARAIQGAAAYAQANNMTMSFAVLDAGGHVVASARMDGAPPFTIEFARGKAWGTAVSGRSSASLAESYQNNPALWGNAATIGYGVPLLPGRGALPIVSNGMLVGAMGASGGPSDQDEAAVAAGLAAAGF
jgi:glc operon protein GlcG